MIEFLFNDQLVTTELALGGVALDFIRRDLRQTGTKEGCKEGECGACTVLLGSLIEGRMIYRNVASCLIPLGDLACHHLITIEGLNPPDGSLNPIQTAFVAEGATQCGFCTPGFILSLTAFFINSPDLSFEDALDAVDGNVCRCTGHVAIRKAIFNLSAEYSKRLEPDRDRLDLLIEWGIVREWMREVPARLAGVKLERPPRDRETIFVAGGTDAFVQRPAALKCAKLEFLAQRPELSYIKEEGGQILLGAGTTVEEIRASKLFGAIFPDNKRNLSLISSTIMRNRASLAGNIINASPIADLTIMLLVLGAKLELEDHNEKRREVKLEDFFKGYKTLDLEPGELLKEVSFPKPEGRYSFEKVSQREYLDIASVNTALLVELEGKTIKRAQVSAGGVAPIPLLLTKTSAALSGQPLEPAVIKAAAKTLAGEIAPIDDVRGTAAYKRVLARQLFFAHWIKLFPEIFKLEDLV